jgi:acetyl esterase/lipase
MRSRARTFAGWGWVAAVVDYRAFADAPGDVVRAYDAARARFPGLPICAYGESAGGQLALMLAVRRPLACVIDAAGPVDLPRLDGTPQADWVRAKALAAFGDLGDASPTHHAAAIRAPMCGCSARTMRTLTSADAAGSSVRSAAVIFSA